MVAACRAVTETFGVEPIFVRRGSSMAIIAQFPNLLHPAPLLMGITGPHDNIHAPNEYFQRTDFIVATERLPICGATTGRW